MKENSKYPNFTLSDLINDFESDMIRKLFTTTWYIPRTTYDLKLKKTFSDIEGDVFNENVVELPETQLQALNNIQTIMDELYQTALVNGTPILEGDNTQDLTLNINYSNPQVDVITDDYDLSSQSVDINLSIKYGGGVISGNQILSGIINYNINNELMPISGIKQTKLDIAMNNLYYELQNSLKVGTIDQGESIPNIFGTLYSIGEGANGRLGISSTSDTNTLIEISIGETWKSVVTSNVSTYAIKNDGTLWGWGENGNNQLGLVGDTVDKIIPTLISSDTDWEVLSTNSSDLTPDILAIKNGQLYGRGDNKDGSVGDGSVDTDIIEFKLLDSSTIIDISVGKYNTFFIKDDGTLWGAGNGEFLGNNDSSLDNITPHVQVQSDSDWRSIYSGEELLSSFSYAIKTDGTLWNWGKNYHGALGRGDNVNRDIPTKYNNDTNWKDVKMGRRYVMVLKTDGSIWSCVDGTSGKLGHGDTIALNTLTQIGTDTDWYSIHIGYESSFATKMNGDLYGWGENGKYELMLSGDTTDKLVPTLIDNSGDRYRDVVGGVDFTIVVK